VNEDPGRPITNSDDFMPVMRSEDLPASANTGSAQPGRPDRVVLPEIRKATCASGEVLVMRLGTGEVVAFATHCPHQQTPLNNASLSGGLLTCPQHNYVYDPKTGANVHPTRQARADTLWRLKPGYLPTFKVVEKDGWIWVAGRPNPPPGPLDGSSAPQGDPAQRGRPPLKEQMAIQANPSNEEAGIVEHLEGSIMLKAGERFELTLPTAPAPGHVWRLEGAADLIGVEGQVFDEVESVYRVKLVGLRAGVARMQWVFSKPWGAAIREVRPYRVEVK